MNGLAVDAPHLQRFCGTVPAGTQVRSSGNTMAVEFRTDASVSSGGFLATYSSDEPAGSILLRAKLKYYLQKNIIHIALIIIAMYPWQFLKHVNAGNHTYT